MTPEAIARDIAIPVDAFGRARAYAARDGVSAYRVWFALDGGRTRSPYVGPAFSKPRQASALAAVLNGEAPTSRRPQHEPEAPSRDTSGGTAAGVFGAPAPGEDFGLPDAPTGQATSPASIPGTPSPDTHSRPGAEPSGMTRIRTAGGPRATSPDGGSPETERAMAQATPGRIETCAGCGGPLPAGRHGQHRATCSPACRQRLRRMRLDPLRRAAEATAATANARAGALDIEGRLTTDDIVALWEVEPVCVRCGKGRGVDHVSPMSAGGANDPSNLQNLCPSCNSRKAAAERRPREATAGHPGEFRLPVDVDSGVTPSEAQRASEALSLWSAEADPVPGGRLDPPPGRPSRTAPHGAGLPAGG